MLTPERYVLVLALGVMLAGGLTVALGVYFARRGDVGAIDALMILPLVLIGGLLLRLLLGRWRG